MIDYWIGFSTYFEPTQPGPDKAAFPVPYMQRSGRTSTSGSLTRRQIHNKIQNYKDWGGLDGVRGHYRRLDAAA